MHRFLNYFTKNKQDIFFLNMPQAVNLVVLLITLPIILYSIPLAAYGQWQFMLALQSWGMIFSAAQITDGSKRGLALGLQGTFFYALLKRSLFLTLPTILFLFLGIYFANIGKEILSGLSCLSAFYIFLNILIPSSISEYFIAKKQFKAWSFWQIATSPFSRIITAIVALLTHSVIFFVLTQVIIGFLLSFLGLIYLIYKKQLWHHFRLKEYDENCVSYGIRFIPIDSIGAISNKLVDVLIGLLFGFTSLAIFSVANEIRNFIANGFKMIGSLLYADFAKQKIENVIKKINQSLISIIILGGVLTLIIIPTAIFYIHTFLSDSLQGSILLLVLLSIGLPLVFPIVLLYTVLNSHFRYKEIALAQAIPGLLKIVLVLIFGYFGGIIGMVIAMVIHLFISFFFYYLVTIKRETFIGILQRSAFLKGVARRY